MREACQIEGSLRWAVAPTRRKEPHGQAEIDFFDPEPPSDLVATDITEGDGAEAKSGDTVSVHYVGVAHSTGEEFDASYNRGTPLQFRLGTGRSSPAGTRASRA
jgi:FKBP-type peptidyl-prolyl cis-trans isomerase